MKKSTPNRILLLKPCCIGDVVLTTPLLAALRRAYPQATITWGIGTHSMQVIQNHPMIDGILNTGNAANPAKSPAGMLHLVRQLRAEQFDMAVVPVRSPLISLAVRLAGIPIRAGLDSAGRGRFYTIKAPVDPAEIRHESDIYLDIARALRLNTTDCWASTHVDPAQVEELRHMLNGVNRLVVVHAGGGQNPGMAMLEKRPPIPLLSNVAARAAAHLKARIAILGGPGDRGRADELHESLHGANPISLVGILNFSQIAALGQIVQLAIGPDTGLLHLLAAAGAPTVMIFGPSDPRRYAPFVPPDRAVAPWRPYPLPDGGVANGPPRNWTWEKNGITANEVWQETQTLLLHRDQDDR